ncbi:hypothetical protein Dimus_027615 [Dionaea muscipula]
MVDSALYDLGKALATLAADKLKEEYTLLVGVREEGQKLQENLKMINSVLAGAEERALMEENIKCWLDLLKDVVYDIEDVLDDWTMEVEFAKQGKPKHDDVQNETASSDQKEKKVCFSSCIPTPCSCFKPIKKVKNRHDIARRIKEINDRLDHIANLKDKYKLESLRGNDQLVIPRRLTTSFGQFKDLHAQTIIKQKVIEALQPAQGTDEVTKIEVTSLVGMGGIGKTTIAKIVYNDADVKSDHFDKLMWVCVSDSFSEMKVSKAILNSLDSNRSSSGFEEIQQVLEEIDKLIKGKRFLLVLDDVWTENDGDWNGIMSSLSSCQPGSRVLVTTRNHRVAQAMKTKVTIPVNELPEEECLSLFQHFAFSGRGESERHNLESIAQEMAKKCKGLALAAETLGRAMAFKSTKREWEGVLKSNLWNFEDEKKAGELPAALLLSYIDLPSPMIKRCFASCCVFQKDQVMSKRDLVWLWMGLGLLRSETGQMEIVGEDYFNILVARSFFKEINDDDGVKMHDIIHDLAQFLMKNEVLLFSEDGEAVNELILNKGSAKIRYLTMVSRRSQLPTVGNDDDLKRLRMLGIEAHDCEPSDLEGVLSKLSCVRVLKIRSQKMNVVPSGSIGKLTHLRYVDFCNCWSLKELPESICDLFCLQTLNIYGCVQLKKLPKGMGKLVNLRHLYNKDSPGQLPKGMKGLSSLQTLPMLDVGESQLDNNHELLGLGDLQNLNSLQGEFRLYGIKGGMIEVEEAEKAALQSKTDISCLGLFFVNDDDRTDDDDEGVTNRRLKVLEALKPHKDLEALEIQDYSGQRFASWINGDWLHNVKKLELSFCQPSLLPPLGTLPSLESLQISHMWGVRSVGEEFLGIEESQSHLASSSSSSPHPAFVALFPKLKTLKFFFLYNWKTWADPKHDNNVQVTNIIIMPSLSTLRIYSCRKLKSLPRFLAAAPIKELKIIGCPLIKESIRDGFEEQYRWVLNKPRSSHGLLQARALLKADQLQPNSVPGQRLQVHASFKEKAVTGLTAAVLTASMVVGSLV